MSATAIVPARESARPLLTLPLSAMLMGLYILAASRSGKSRLLGRELVWQGYYWEIPQIVFDATGIGTIDNFLDKLIRQLQYVEKQYDKRLM
jgi:hypothetical protein